MSYLLDAIADDYEAAVQLRAGVNDPAFTRAARRVEAALKMLGTALEQFGAAAAQVEPTDLGKRLVSVPPSEMELTKRRRRIAALRSALAKLEGARQ